MPRLSLIACLSLLGGLSSLPNWACASESEATLAVERSRLAEVELRWDVNHPKLSEQYFRVAAWESVLHLYPQASRCFHDAVVEQQILERRHGDQSPALQRLRARVDAMRSILVRDASAPAELLLAHADLASAKLRWGDRNPRLADLQRKVDAYDLHLIGSSPISFEVRLLRAKRDHLAGRYGENHPRIVEISQQLADSASTSN